MLSGEWGRACREPLGATYHNYLSLDVTMYRSSGQKFYNCAGGKLRMITIGMNYKVLPGKEDNFERVFKNVLHSLQRVVGHGKSALYQDVTDRQSYLIVSEWNSEEAFNAFVHSEKFRGVVDWGQENILADRPVHTVYR
jgi:heme-degrading monooxygenase HmoA